MNTALMLILFLAGTEAMSADAIEHCRAAHAGDAGAHISCLEDALRRKKDEIGLEQIEARERASEDKPEPVQVQIVSVAYDGHSRGVFRTADGQVWRETELLDRRPRLKAGVQYNARLERAALGGYRMYVDGLKWMYKVERLE